MIWERTTRGNPAARALADRHYNRQKIGAPQFMPPGRCFVLMTPAQDAVFGVSWPRFAQHQWRGAWINTLFRKEGGGVASEMIVGGILWAQAIWGAAPALGIVSFVDPEEVPGVIVRGRRIFGFCYLRAGFRHVGFTQSGLWAWQMLPGEMPPARASRRISLPDEAPGTADGHPQPCLSAGAVPGAPRPLKGDCI